VAAAITALNENAQNRPTGNCAAYVREAIEAGGITLERPDSNHAEDYGPSLEAAGFIQLNPTPPPDYSAQAGDVVVIQHYPGGNPAGHIEMNDGEHWDSDFVQNADNIPQHNNVWPGPRYREFTPSYAVYRP
jgi:hypothetical protein